MPKPTIYVNNQKVDQPERRFHAAGECVGDCPLHRPSDHHMRDWPLNWRGDLYLFERICPHGVGHPDPDSLVWLRQQVAGSRPQEDLEMLGVHGCDGCCSRV